MAKAKKPAAKKTFEKQQEKPKEAAPATSATPAIDTAHAAQTAATMVAGGHTTTPTTTPASADQKESGAFKNLKQNLLKPHTASSGGNLVHPTGGRDGKRSNSSSGFGAQRGRNQTFGADVNRSGVPRRTGG